MSDNQQNSFKSVTPSLKTWTLFYNLKPLIPRQFQLWIRRLIIRQRRRAYSHLWPIDAKAATPPTRWPGWPERRKFALILSHDVDTLKGHDACPQLAGIEKALGFRSAFNFVPERYRHSALLRDSLRRDGFEIGVHGLKHDGKLFRSYKIFTERAARINHYLNEWQTGGFTSPSMHHNLRWMHHLNITYSTSTFDTDPFEPQPDGVGTIFPFWVADRRTSRGGFVELPYTLPQDFTLFILMRQRRIDIWTSKLAWIAEHGGMVLVNTHPDYMNFENSPVGPEEYPIKHYIDFLLHIKNRYAGQYFHATPGDIARRMAPFLSAHEAAPKSALRSYPEIKILQ